jgi:hypothetical protein
MRRGFLFGLVALAAVAALPARGQDPRASDAQRAAREWLALADKLDGSATWDAAGQQFQAAMKKPRWTRALNDARGPFGPVLQRAVSSTQFMKSIPGQPDGDYALLQFRTSFEKKESARETVTLESSDGKWRVVGYFIR